MLSREQFDSIEFDAAVSGDHAAAARQMFELATAGTQTAAMPRAEAFLRAGEQWLLADDPVQAVLGFRRAMDDGGPVFSDPRVPLARALFQLGDIDEAQQLITAIKTEGPADPRTCDLVAELLVERSELAAALDWATAGVELCLASARQPDAAQPDAAQPDAAQPDAAQPDAARPDTSVPSDRQRHGIDDAELRLLLRLRYRIRIDLGLPEDDYDAMLDES